MNENDMSELSYRELQALALRYRVPGNIKKDLLIRVLEAAKGGNESEVGRMLAELKQTRKKKVKKVKRRKLNLTSTPIHSPAYTMTEDYYCPQQQLPYQWVGAEEEIVSREDESNKISPYEEFRKFLLGRIQQEYQSYDKNNNSDIVESTSVVDLRTVVEPAGLDSIVLEPRSNMIKVNESDMKMQLISNNTEYQILEDSNGNPRGPILLKKMLQAPVGANLGEIASPELRNYRVWSTEYQTPNNLLDSSDTLTADSENNRNDDNWANSTEYYHLINNVNDQIFLTQPQLANKNIEATGQFPNTVFNESSNQYQYIYPGLDSQPNYQKWMATNTMQIRDSNPFKPGKDNSKAFQEIYYSGSESSCMNNEHSYNHTGNNMTVYELNQNAVDVNSRKEFQYYQNQNDISTLRLDPSGVYHSQQFMKQMEEMNGTYLRSAYPTMNVYASTIQQIDSSQQDEMSNIYKYPKESSILFPQSDFNNAQYNSGLFQQYASAPDNQQFSLPLVESSEQQPSENIIVEQETNVQKDLMSTGITQSQLNGTFGPYWPRWSTNSSTDNNLENILNLHEHNYVDHSKIDQTSCVFCYKAPIVTQSPMSSNSLCSQKKRFIAEYRQHTFTPYWLLYNDTSTGMQLANLADITNKEKPEEQIETAVDVKSTADVNSEIRESTESEDSIDNIWIHDYTNYELTSQKDTPDPEVIVSEDLNNENLFLTEPIESQTSQLDDICNNQKKNDVNYYKVL